LSLGEQAQDQLDRDAQTPDDWLSAKDVRVHGEALKQLLICHGLLAPPPATRSGQDQGLKWLRRFDATRRKYSQVDRWNMGARHPGPHGKIKRYAACRPTPCRGWSFRRNKAWALGLGRPRRGPWFLSGKAVPRGGTNRGSGASGVA